MKKQHGFALLIPIAALSGLLVGVLGGVLVVKKRRLSARATEVADSMAAVESTKTLDASIHHEKIIADAGNRASKPVVTAQVHFDVSPLDVLNDVEIKVDGEVIEGTRFERVLSDGSKIIDVSFRAKGYKTLVKTYKIVGSRTIAVSLKQNRPLTSKKSGLPKKQNKASNSKSNTKGPGGLLDL